MKQKTLFLIGLLALGFSLTANAGAISDSDADLVPDYLDNCIVDVNGPLDGSNQVDADLDGYGNACDADYNNMNGVTVSDFTIFIGCLGDSPDAPLCDHNGRNGVSVADFSTFLRLLGPPSLTGPSGLACAGTVPCFP